MKRTIAPIYWFLPRCCLAVAIALPLWSMGLLSGQMAAWARGGFEETGRPPSRVSGGSRGDCLQQVIALVPGQGQIEKECQAQSEALLARSLTDTPTFWFYVPAQAASQTASAAPTPLAAQFILLDENQTPIAIQSVSLPQTGGIIHVSLAQPLTANRAYRWIFSILRNPRRPSQNPRVEGVVQWQPANSSLQRQLQQATTLADRLAIYAEQEIWHDALTELAQTRQQNQNDAGLQTTWVNFLTSQGLEAIAAVPILECCTP